jgi:hypothetical protein
LEALLFEVSILNCVIHRDPFCGHFVEPCSDLKCTGVNIVDHSLSIPRLLVVIIVMVVECCVSSTLLCTSCVITVNVYWEINYEMIIVQCNF